MIKHDKTIRHIIFDLGNVLIDIHPEQTMAELAQHCLTPIHILKKLFLSPLHLRFMKGEMSAQDFFLEIGKRYRCNLSYDEFIAIWFQLIGNLKTGMGELLKELSQYFTLSLCSNTDPLHWQYVRNTYPVMSIFQHNFLSFELKMLKPDEDIFRYVLKVLATPASECVFIDDTIANIDTAKRLGFRTIHASTVAEIREQLSFRKSNEGTTDDNAPDGSP